MSEIYHIVFCFTWDIWDSVLDEGEKSHKGTGIGILFHNKCKGCEDGTMVIAESSSSPACWPQWRYIKIKACAPI